jgi:hypothetical protein
MITDKLILMLLKSRPWILFYINCHSFGSASLRLRIQSHIQLQFKRLITKLNVVLSNMFH